MSKKKRRKDPYEMRKKRKRRAALIRVFLVMALVGGTVFGLVQINKSIEVPLVVDAENYYCIATEEETGEPLDETEEYIPADAQVQKPLVAQPKLRREYPIETVLQSEYAIVYDVQADEVLFAKNADQKCYPASTTKILTSAVILDNVDEDFTFTAGDELDFVNPESSLAYIEKGNVLNLETALDAIMLPSGNDASYMAAANVGRKIAGTDGITPENAVKTFVDEMNRTAALIGAENTHFANPDGFHDDDHYTTVLDMLKITLYARKKPLIVASAAKPSEYAVFESGEQISWKNSNKLIHEDSGCYYMYANGFKTGMTDQSGYCVVATARRFDHDVICIVFGASASDIRWNETISLLDSAFAEIRSREGL
ncbi:MAG: D-alanyl-D-alanine carboxypeptidase [Oscillospiraceae bacterium]|nr:D-alanyl-D-alanine carboxypeptidase [Oscillospiraceae bacterium]